MRREGFVVLMFVILAAGMIFGADKVKSVVKSSHLSPNVVAITCLNGADPTGTKAGQNVLLVSCGR